MKSDTRRRCAHCGRFVSQWHTLTETQHTVAGAFVTTYTCDACLDNALPTDNEGGYTRITNQFDAARETA